MKKQTITAVIPTLNEEHNIERALKSVEWCDNIIVVDSGSSDKTVEIAKEMGAKIHIAHQGELFVGVQKNINWAGEHCGTDWVLRIDADEEVTNSLQEEIKRILEKDVEHVAFGLPRNQYFLGKFLKGGDWAYDRLIRLYKPQFAYYEAIASVHEQFVINGSKGVLKHALNHYSHPTWKEVNAKWQLYTDLEAKDLKISKFSAFVKMLFVPPYVFARWIIYHRGWIDGAHGFIAGATRGYYDFLKFYKYLISK